jgi:hypothetical protein
MAVQIIAIVFSAAASLLSGLVLWQFREQSERIARIERGHTDLLTRLAGCRQECNRSFVEKETFLREAGFSRDKLDDMSNTLSRMEGKLQITEQLPNICGRIASEVAAQFSKRES